MVGMSRMKFWVLSGSSMGEHIFLALVLLLLFPAIIHKSIQRILTAQDRRRTIRRHGCLPPAAFPHTDPFLGIDGIRAALLAGKEKRFLPRVRDQYRRYGNTFSSRFLTYGVINTIEPANIRSVLSTDFKSYCIGSRRKDSFAPLLGRSIGLFDGQEWEHSRAMLRPSFAKAQIGNLSLYETHVQNLLQVMMDAKGKGTGDDEDDATMGVEVEADLQELFFRFTADVTTDLMFGESIGSLLHPTSSEANIARIILEAVIECEKRWQLGWLARFSPQPGFWRNIDAIRKYIDPYVEKAVMHRRALEQSRQDHRLIAAGDKEQRDDDDGDNDNHEDGRYVFLHEISKRTSDRTILRDELLSLFFGGRDTTACLLSNLFFVLARRPDIWARIRSEVAQLENGIPTIATIKQLRYVRFCLLECSLGFFPPFPLITSRIFDRCTFDTTPSIPLTLFSSIYFNFTKQCHP